MGKGFLASFPVSSTTVFDYLIICILFLTIVFIYYYNFAVKKPSIHSGNEKLKRFLRLHVPVLNRKYWPSFCYFEGRLQTIFSLTKRLPKERLMYQREMLTMKDGEQVGLDFLHPPVEQCDSQSDEGIECDSYNRETPLVVLVVPAFSSTSQASYMKTLALSIVNFGGATAAVLNYRGLGGVPLSTPRMVAATNCEDIREVITHLRQKFPNSKLMAVGTSMGGIILGHYLTQYADEAKESLTATALISIIWDVWPACKNMEMPINLFCVNKPLAQIGLKFLKKNRKILEKQGCFDYKKLMRSTTLKELDERYVVPQYGFKSIDDYYTRATLCNSTDKFSIPVFALNAYDDPVSPGKDLPIKKAESADSNLALIITSRGGHLGFLEGWFPKMKQVHYMEKVVGQLVKGIRIHGAEINIQKSN